MSVVKQDTHDESDEYIKNFFTMITAPATSTAMNGALQSPCNPRHNLFVMEGSHTLVAMGGTARVVVLLDAEATLRNGQATAYALEYTANGELQNMTNIPISAGSADFSCASVVAMRMDVKSASSVNEVTGHITGAVLNTVPKDVHNLTATRLRQKTPNKGDQSTCLLRDDGISLLAITTHMGAKPVSLDANSYPQTENSFAVYVGGTDSSINGFDTNQQPFRASNAQMVNSVITPQVARDLEVGNETNRIWDSARLGPDAHNVFTLGTYGMELQWHGDVEIKDANAQQGGTQVMIFTCVVLDYVGDVMSTQDISITMQHRDTANEPQSVDLNFEFMRQTRPIARAFFYCSRSSFASDISVNMIPPSGDILMNPRQRVKVRGITNTGDLADRDIGIVIGEGLAASPTQGASLNIECCLVVSAIPSADRTFISGGASDTFVDDALIKSYLRTVLKGVPRASVHTEIGEISSVISHIMSIKDHSELFHAWSFGSIGRAFKHVASTVRSGVRGFDKVLTKALPVMKNVGHYVSEYGKYVPIIGDEVSEAGTLLEVGAKVGEKIHGVTQHAYDSRTGRMLKHTGNMYAMNTY